MKLSCQRKKRSCGRRFWYFYQPFSWHSCVLRCSLERVDINRMRRVSDVTENTKRPAVAILRFLLVHLVTAQKKKEMLFAATRRVPAVVGVFPIIKIKIKFGIAPSLRSSGLAACRRWQSQVPTPTNTSTDPELIAEKKANAIIDALPGNSIVSKTGILTAGVGAATYLISKEIYVLNEESLIVLSFAAIVTSLIRGLREPYNQWAADQINKMKQTLINARKDHADAVQSRIDNVAQLSDVVSVTKDLFEMSKEMADMEAQAFELRQRVQLASEVRSVLDSWVRYEAGVREREQKKVADSVVERVMKQLEDAKVQREILAQSLKDVELAVASSK